MNKLASKLNKRIMAAVLSVAMVMSNMTVYASELTAPQVENTVDEAVVDAEDTYVTPDDAATSDESSETDAVVDETNGETADTPDDDTTGDVTGDDVQAPDAGEEESSDSDKVDEVGIEDGSLESDEEVKDEEEILAEEPSKSEAGELNYAYEADNKAIDISNGLNAGKTYGDSEILKLEVLEDMTASDVANGKTIDGVTYNKSIQGKGNPSPSNGAIPKSGAVFKITALKYSTIKFVTGSAAKSYYFVDGTDADAPVTLKTETAIPEGTLSFSMEKGKTYYFYGAGTKVKLFAISYKEEEAPPEPQDIDISGGLKAKDDNNEIKYYGDPELLQLSVLEDMNAKDVDPVKTIDGVDYNKSIQGDNNPKTNGSNSSGKIPDTGAAFKITAVKNATISFVTASAAKTYFFIDGTDAAAPTTVKTETAIPEGTLKFNVKAGKTYYFYANGSKVTLYAISYVESVAKDWGEVDAPKLAPPALSTDKGQINVTVSAEVGTQGGDKVSVIMYKNDVNDEDAVTLTSTDVQSEHTLSFTPNASGTYKFKASLSREGETDKESAEVSYENFVLPLDAPNITSIENKGKVTGSDPESGSVEIKWDKVPEATGYKVSVKQGDNDIAIDGTNTSKTLDGETTTVTINQNLTINTVYTFCVAALRTTEGASEPETSNEATRSFGITANAGGKYVPEGTYVLDVATDLDIMATQGSKDGKAELAGTADYFIVHYGAASQVESHNPGAFSDGYTPSRRLNFRNIDTAFTASSDSIEFSTSALARVKIWWRCAGDDRQMKIIDSNGEQAAITNEDSLNNSSYISTLTLNEGGTYYLGGAPSSSYIYKVEVINGYEPPSRTDWDKMEKPVIKNVAFKTGSNTVLEVTVTADVSETGADKVTVSMINKDDETKVYTKISEAPKAEHTVEITPNASGEYKFVATLSRKDDDTTLDGLEYPEGDKYYSFTLPLVIPSIKGVTNKGAVDGDKKFGSAELSWSAVPEATSYVVKAVDKAAAASAAPVYDKEIAATFVTIDQGLEIGHTYIFSVAAKRTGTGVDGADEITETDTQELEIKDENKRSWFFSAYGDSTSTKKNGYTDADNVGDANKTILEGSGDVRVWSEGGAGKIVPASVDGLAFYYTTVDPNVKNFKLSAIAHVNSWDISNGQDGFGLMAADRVGTHGNSGKWWNNSYQALASKIEYRWDPNLNAADYSSNTEYTRYSMKLGIGTTEKRGVTKENLPLLNNTDTVVAATKRYFKSTTKTLETYCGRNGLAGGTWNVIGNYTKGNTPEGTVSDSALVTDLLFSIELNNTGYYLSYTPITVEKNADGSIKRDENGNAVYNETGEKVTNKHYDRNALSKLEEDSVYVGFFASRNADVTFMNIKLDDSEAYDPNGEVEQQPIEKIDPAYGFTSGTTANESSYDLLFAANWQGHVTVKDSAGNVIVGWDTTTLKGEEESDEDYIIRTGRVLDEVDTQTGEYLWTYEPIRVPVELGLGTTTFTYTFVPDNIDNYNPDPNPEYDAESNSSVPKGFTMLSDYSSQSGTITVTYKTYGESGNALYVSPTGTALGNGTQKNPLDIYTAVKYVQAGQTIYLMGEKYNLTKTVTIDRGINGTEKDRIYMLPADPSIRPQFNFNKQCEGIVVAGDYWYLKGFDVTRSANAKDGMRISGSHNVIEQVHAYENGNTGIQISRYSGSDTWDYWPSYNLVLNCTSYLNSDQGFEDADGFTAKLTIADGNVFDGCIAAYNADDGWDLFAKVESGNIGRVIIKNCIAYKNGYVLVKDTDGDGKISQAEARATDRVFSLTEGIETPAGNGNGFKLGGSNLPDRNGANGITGWDAGHTVENCLAFYNKAKGIDSNSCPNIKAKNSISYNNEGANVAFYGTASNTDFAADGLISYRTESAIKGMLDIHDNIQPLGTQQKNNGATGMSAFYNNKSYYWNPNSMTSIQIDAAATAANIGTGEGKWSDARPDKDHVVWKESGTKVADNWFVKIGEAEFKLFDQGFRNDTDSIRNADNTITTNGFLMLTENALVGGSLGGANHEEQGKLPEIPNVTDTDGSISKGDAADETSGGVAPEDMDKFIELNGTIKDSEDIIGLWFNVVEDVYYTGRAVKPLVHVYNGTTQLTKKDYSITYRNNINAYVDDATADDYDASYKELKDRKKVPTIIVRGKGNYIGVVEATFDIHPVDLSNDDTDYALNGVNADDTLNSVGANDLTLASTGKALNVKPVVTFGNRRLSNARNKDYAIDGIYQINEDTEPTLVTSVTSKGTYEIRITGHGNFTGKRNIGLRVYDKSGIDNAHLVSKFRVDKIADQYRKVISTSNYTGAITDAEPRTPELTVKNSSGTPVKAVEDDGKVNYTVTYKNNVEIGTATAIITGEGDYYGTKEVKFRIIAPRINLMERQRELTIVDTSKSANETTGMYPEFVNRTNEYAFAGKAIEPSIAVQLKDGTLLSKGEDYILKFVNNNRVGTASVVIKGKGNYSGSISKTFKITVFDLADAKNRQYIGGTFKFATVESDDGSVSYSSNYATTLSVAAEKGTIRPEVTLTINGVTMKKGRDYTVTYKNNTYAAQQRSKKPQVIIRGRGALKGMLTKDFTITKKNLNQVTVTAQDVKISSKKGDAVSGNIAARIVLQDSNGKRLSAGADYDRNIEYILLDDYGNESGTSTTKGSIENNKRITINKFTNVLTVRAIIKASTAANSSYTGQTTVDFQVGYAKLSLNSARYEIDYKNGRFKYFNYTGDNIMITDNLKVYVGKDELTVNEDYEILPATYKNNNKKGTASVVIRGKGNYSGTKVITFRIGAQNISEIGWWTAK